MISQSCCVPLRLLNCLLVERRPTPNEQKCSRRRRIGSKEQEESRGEAALGIGAGEQEVLKDLVGCSSQARKKVFFSSGYTGIGDIGVPLILASASCLDTTEEPSCIEVVQWAAKERVKRALKMLPVPSWKARASEGMF
jgi:hypothetical protein